MPVRGFKSQGIVAAFEEPNQTGEREDFDAARNGPAKDPASYLDKLWFHSACDYFELAGPKQTVTVNHSALSTGSDTKIDYTGAFSGAQFTVTVKGETRTTDITLVTHDLGYVPRYMIAYSGHNLANGTQVQGGGDYERTVCHYATDSEIVLFEIANAGASNLPAVDLSYEVLVFATPAADPGKALMFADSGVVEIGRGLVTTAKQYARKPLPAESAFDLDLGVGLDFANGRCRIVSGGVSYSEAGYTGSFAGPAFVPIGGTD